MTEQEFKEYLKEIQHSSKFYELNRFIRMTEYKGQSFSVLENVIQYISYQHPRTDVDKFFAPDYDHFYRFFEAYRQGKPAEIVTDEKGYIDFRKTLFLKQPFKFASRYGVFTDANIISTDGTIYISKKPLNYVGKSGVGDSSCRFCAIIASEIAKEIGVESAEYRLARRYNGEIRLLSKNFLKPGEELVTFFGDEEVQDPSQKGTTKISKIFEELEKKLSLRKYSKEEIDRIKMDFLKQEFLAKLIGLKDQKADNSGLIVSLREDGKRSIRLAPMFDYDYSFHIAEQFEMMRVRKCDNGEIDIGSFIRQYKDYPGFIDFVNQAISSLDMTNVFRHLAADSGLKEFETPDERFLPFADFVNKNKQIAIETLARISQHERED